MVIVIHSWCLPGNQKERRIKSLRESQVVFFITVKNTKLTLSRMCSPMWRISAICAEVSNNLRCLNPLWLTVNIWHHGKSSGWTYLNFAWCNKLHPIWYSWERSNKHRKWLTNTVWPRWSAELPCPSSCFSTMSPLPDSTRSPRHSPHLISSPFCWCTDVSEDYVVILGQLFNGYSTCIFVTTTDISMNTAPHPKPYSKDWFFRLFLSLCILLHTAGRVRLPYRMRHCWSALDFKLQCWVFLPWRSPFFLMFKK